MTWLGLPPKVLGLLDLWSQVPQLVELPSEARLAPPAGGTEAVLPSAARLARMGGGTEAVLPSGARLAPPPAETEAALPEAAPSPPALKEVFLHELRRALK